MKLRTPPGVHLTYCTNIHPGESWQEVREALRTHVADVKRRLVPAEPFGVGLRLSARAARELEAPGALEAAKAELDEAGLYVFTLNGFPYGAFHATRVKEGVYRPDWLEDERVAYTASLTRVLAGLLPDGVAGSISTVPGSFAERAREPSSARAIARNVARAAVPLLELERELGKVVTLALEPEPACLLETAEDAVRFFEHELFSSDVLGEFATLVGLDMNAAEGELRRHVGVCLDACHASVEFESPLSALEHLRAAGILVPKIQLSAGLRLQSATPEALDALRPFDDGVYLHQTVVHPVGQSSGRATLRHFLDLPQALEARAELGHGAEWRIHFHVPVFETQLGPFSSTQGDLKDLLLRAPELAGHLEVETYTFDVLPPEHRKRTVTEAIARELEWVLDVLEER